MRAATRGLAGDVIVAAVADEEFASVGAQALVRGRPADAAIVTEPTALDVCVAHRGFAWWEVEVEGFAAHGSRPEVGVDAIAKTGRLLTGVEELDRRLRAGEGHPYVGTGSVHASLIEGGQELSSYPERCRLQVERRTAPGETEAVVQAELDALLDAARAADPAFRATGRVTLVREPFAVDPAERVVRGVQRRGDAGARPHARSSSATARGWTRRSSRRPASRPSCSGPAGDGHHGVEEWVDLASVQATVDILDAAIEGALRLSRERTKGRLDGRPFAERTDGSSAERLEPGPPARREPPVAVGAAVRPQVAAGDAGTHRRARRLVDVVDVAAADDVRRGVGDVQDGVVVAVGVGRRVGQRHHDPALRVAGAGVDVLGVHRAGDEAAQVDLHLQVGAGLLARPRSP